MIQLGILTRVEYKPAKARTRSLVTRWALAKGPILAYGPGVASLAIVYPVRRLGRSNASAMREYQRTHWGEAGDGVDVAGHVALEPLTVLGEIRSITYTTKKGGDAGQTDYEHEFGDGAKGEWKPPVLLVHRCKVARCAHADALALRGGTYRVTSHGIVG